MDMGPEKRRRKFTTAHEDFSVKLAITAAQKVLLDAFYTTTLVYGTLFFDYYHPRTEALLSMRMAQAPQYVPNGHEYMASLVLQGAL
jgi:hypothetical protein